MALLLLLAAWLALFDGQSLKGWDHTGPRPSFAAVNGTLRTSGRAHAGNWIHTSREYEDFRLRFEYKLDQWAEAAVVLRAARSQRPQHTGITLVLAHDFHNETTPWITGAIMGVRPPGVTFAASFDRWHKVEIELRGSAFKASIDGAVVQDLDLQSVPELRHRLRRGVIGFPDMGHPYCLRNVEIEDLGSPTQFVELDNIDGWARRGASGEWRAHGGVIEAYNGDSILYAPPVFQDFELTAAVRTHSRVNSGIFLRGQPEGPNRGFEVQIYSPVDAVYQTGSIYGRSRSALEADLEEQWFLLQIRVQGSRCTVWIDGREVADFAELPPELRRPGRIGLQLHSPDARVEFRDLRVRGL
jgi:hypothetical protein